ncbi:hypothetical protein FP828_05880 [bacterium]|nr:hypothetical protein [bacterium]
MKKILFKCRKLACAIFLAALPISNIYAGEAIYDFSGGSSDTNKVGYWVDSNWLSISNPDIAGQAAFPASAYSLVNSSDASHYVSTATALHAMHHFKFIIGEDTNTIDGISVEWVGKGNDFNSGNQYCKLGIWNYQTKARDIFDSDTGVVAEVTLSSTISLGYLQYIDTTTSRLDLIIVGGKYSNPNVGEIWTNYVKVVISTQAPADTTPPYIADNQTGDDVVRNSAGTTYNVDFADAGTGLDTIQYKVMSGPSQTGNLIIDWTNIALPGGAANYTTDWTVNFNSLYSSPGTNYVSVRAWDVAGTTGTMNDVFYILKDITPPAAISNLTALVGSNAGEIQLKWTAPGDDGTMGGSASQYDVKYATKYIGTADYNASWTHTYVQSWTPAAPGSQEPPILAGFNEGVTYWFAIKAKDDANNWSSWTSSGTVPSVNYNNSNWAQVVQGGIWKSIQGGNWGVGATWDKGTVPNSLSVVQISHTVTFNMFEAMCSSVSVMNFGTLKFDGAVSSRTLTVAGNLEIMNGGQFLMPPNTGYISTLKIKCVSAGEHGIIVNNGGKFDVQGNIDTTPSTRNCLIASENSSYKTYIRNYSQTEANFNMHYVEVSSVGVAVAGKYGITFDGAGTRGKINYSSIHNGYYGIYLWNSSNNTISNNSCYSNVNYGILLFNSFNNTITNNICYSNTSGGIYLNSSANNTISGNSCYSNSSAGIYLNTNSNGNVIANNDCYLNSSVGIYINNTSNNNIVSNNESYSNAYGVYSQASINNTVVNCALGKSGNNTSGDIGYDSTAVSKLTLKGCNLYSTTKVDAAGMDTAGSYLISYNQDTLQGSVQVWGDYHVGQGQALPLQKFNYGELLYVSTATLPNSTLKGTGSISYPTTEDGKTLTELWEVRCINAAATSEFSVKRGTGTVLYDDTPGTVTEGFEHISNNRGVKFTVQTGDYQLDDVFYFVSISSSGDQNIQKKIEFNDSPIGTKLTVDTAGTIQMIGTPANPTISTSAVAGTYYGFITSGAINASNYKFSNLNSEGLRLQYAGTTVVDLSSGTFDNIQDSAGDSSYIRASALASAATFTTAYLTIRRVRRIIMLRRTDRE